MPLSSCRKGTSLFWISSCYAYRSVLSIPTRSISFNSRTATQNWRMGLCISKKSSEATTEKQPEPVTPEPALNEPKQFDIPQKKDISNRACFGAGCYWGTEKYFTINFGRQMFPEAMIKGKVGFMGPKGSKPNPTYKEVCSGSTGHVEVYDLSYKGGEDMYREIVKFFFQFHDPTTQNQQGNDKGTQYASAIFCYDDTQRAIALDVIKELQEHLDNGTLTCFKNKQITTAVLESTEFFEAQEDHQEYLSKNPNGYCNHRIRIKEWPKKI